MSKKTDKYLQAFQTSPEPEFLSLEDCFEAFKTGSLVWVVDNTDMRAEPRQVRISGMTNDIQHSDTPDFRFQYTMCCVQPNQHPYRTEKDAKYGALKIAYWNLYRSQENVKSNEARLVKLALTGS